MTVATQQPIEQWSEEKIRAAREQFTDWWLERQEMIAAKKTAAKKYGDQIAECEQNMDLLCRELQTQTGNIFG